MQQEYRMTSLKYEISVRRCDLNPGTNSYVGFLLLAEVFHYLCYCGRPLNSLANGQQ
jgi:hypothetical protein